MKRWLHPACLFLGILFFGIFSFVPLHAAEISVFGSESYTRDSGSPVTVSNDFEVPVAREGVIRLTNGLEDDTVINDLVSSSIIQLNGQTIFDPSQFNQNVTSLEANVQLIEGTNTLTVELRGKPGGTLSLEVFAFNEPPTASFTATPNSGLLPLTVNFDASASSDPDNDISSYSWDFGEAGAPAGSGVTASHTYTTPGTFTATLTVTDVFGITSVATQSVEVINAPPVAVFTAVPTTGPVPLTVAFDASASTDPNNNIASYSWDFGDGSPVASGITVSHVYTSPGIFSITLTVTDAFGLTDQQTTTIEVLNSPPVAAFTANTSSGQAPLTVTFDASASTDPDNNIATYDWDFGEPGSSPASGVTASHTFNTGGTFTVTLTVADAFGLTDTATTSIEVLANTPPVIAFTVPREGGFVIVNRPEIRVAYSDDKAVDTGSLAFTLNGQPFTSVDCVLNNSFATCTPTADLPEGNIALTATVSDLEGESTTAQTSFFIDSVPVEVAILSPADRFITNGDNILVTGAISDNITSVEVNGVTGVINGLTFTATVPLREGKNMLVATGRNVNGKIGVGAVDVTRDIQKPIVRIDSPRDNFPSIHNSITVTGVVNDIVDGGVAATVIVNGISAPVVRGTFLVENVPLGLGPNAITAIATDAVGNTGTHTINVNFTPPVGPRLSLSSGNGQSGTVSQALAQELSARITDDNGDPVTGRMVRFEVTRNNGTLVSNGGIQQSPRIVLSPTDGNGEARATLTLGNTAGGGNNRVKVTSVGVAGELEFCATGFPEPPDKIIMSMGDNQRGVIGEPLPIPLEALAVDPGGNPIEGLPVTFNVVTGSGNLEGTASVVKITGLDGIARTVFTLGYEPGINNNVASARFENLDGLSATFTASALEPGDPANTTFSGVVLDNSQQPIPNATVSIDGAPASVLTDSEGQFLITSVPTGHIHLRIDPSTSPRPETFPPLEFETVTIPGQENILGQPIQIPPIDVSNAKVVGGAQDVVLTMANVPGLELKVFANSTTFKDGSNTGTVSISQVHLDKIPMTPTSGVIPSVAWTIQPAGVVFDPPAQITIPNDGLAPGTLVGIDQFDHDLFTFVRVAQGHVSEDGLTVTSDPGFGIHSAGWGCRHDPPPPQTCNCNADDGNECTNDTCQGIPCRPENDPIPFKLLEDDQENDCLRRVCQDGGEITQEDTTDGPTPEFCSKQDDIFVEIVSPAEPTVAIGRTIQLTAKGYARNDGNSVQGTFEWSVTGSSFLSIESVASGGNTSVATVKGLMKGSPTVEVTFTCSECNDGAGLNASDLVSVPVVGSVSLVSINANDPHNTEFIYEIAGGAQLNSYTFKIGNNVIDSNANGPFEGQIVATIDQDSIPLGTGNIFLNFDDGSSLKSVPCSYNRNQDLVSEKELEFRRYPDDGVGFVLFEIIHSLTEQFQEIKYCDDVSLSAGSKTTWVGKSTAQVEVLQGLNLKLAEWTESHLYRTPDGDFIFTNNMDDDPGPFFISPVPARDIFKVKTESFVEYFAFDKSLEGIAEIESFSLDLPGGSNTPTIPFLLIPGTSNTEIDVLIQE